MAGMSLLLEGFKIADNVLLTAAKGIAEIITVKAYINIDFKDVNTVMRDSGVAIMGTGIASGENRAMQAIEEAIRSPLLNDNDITGAQNILLYLSSFEKDISFDEITEITEYITSKSGPNVDVIWGAGQDPTLGDKISVTIVATGFDKEPEKPKEPTKYDLYSQGNKEKAHDEVGVPRPTRPAAEPTITVETDEDLDEIKLISSVEEEQQKKDPPMMPISEFDDVDEMAESEETATAEVPPVESTSESPLAEKKPEIIRFSLDDPMPEPGIKESITEVSEPTNKTVEADPDESAYYEQEAKLRTIERKDVEPGMPEGKESAEKKHKERVEKLRQMSIKLRSPGGLNELEDEPAYRRKNVELSDEKPSEESQVSRYTLSDEDEGSTLKDNPFLHDNVD